MRFAASLLSTLLFLLPLAAAPIGWRNDGTGTYPDAQPPTDWSADHVLWKIKLPGHSFGSPVVAGERLFVVSDPAELLAINRADGEIVWRRSHALKDLYDPDTDKRITAQFTQLIKERGRLHHELGKAKNDKDKQAEIRQELQALEKRYRELEKKYPVPPALGNRGSGNTAATPLYDGQSVYALFANGIACAYTRDGRKLWIKFLEPSPVGFGHSASPVLVDGKLLVHFQDLVALEPKTGQEIWRTRLGPTHATPVPTRVGDTWVVVCPAGAVVRVADGKVLHRDGKLSSSECTSLVKDGILYVCHDRARALRLVPAGADAVKQEQLWECRLSAGRRTPSSVLHQGRLYAVTTDGLLDVVEARTGKRLYQQRLHIGQDYASATAAGPYIFFGGTNGAVLVLQPGDEYQEMARTKVEGFGSCPVFAGQRLYLRAGQHLYCIGK
jgi:outer membrane protein assembly factor BamB